jgi:hypothetical protein
MKALTFCVLLLGTPAISSTQHKLETTVQASAANETLSIKQVKSLCHDWITTHHLTEAKVDLYQVIHQDGSVLTKAECSGYSWPKDDLIDP